MNKSKNLTAGGLLLAWMLCFGSFGVAPAWAELGAQGAGKRIAQKAKKKTPLRARLKKLDLSKEQEAKLMEHRANFRKRMAEIKARIQLRKVDLENEMEKLKPDPKKVESLTQEIKDLMKERRDERTKANQEVQGSILTPEQLEKWRKLEKE